MKRLVSLLLALAMCVSLTACWESESTEPQDFWEMEREPSEPPPERESTKATVFTLPYLNSQTLDPVACADGVQQVVGSLLYEGLFTLDERFEPQPTLCTSCSRSSNGLTYTFTLRDGVVFSNGAPLTAADVLATYRRAQASDRYAARFANVTDMRVNRSAFVMTLKQADDGLCAMLDIPIVKSGTEKDTVPVGTGPYMFHTDADGTFLVRNESWWGGTAPMERIALAPAKDADTAAYLFSAENAHLLPADLLSETSASALGGVDIADASTATMLFLGFNTRRTVLGQAAMRRAMSAAIDRGAVVETLLAGHAAAAQFPIHPDAALYPAALETPFESGAYAAALSPEAEERLIATVAGQLELSLLVNEENNFKVSVAEHLAKQLTAANITIKPVVLPWQDYLAALERGDFDLWLGEVRLTADWDVAALVEKDGALNYGKYNDAALSKALKAFLASENERTATAFYERFAEEAPFLPLVFKSISILTPEGLIGGVSPTLTRPLRGLESWTFHFPEA
ncbi:MAG: ABC transporter substrate-binding protein [Ruminococcaceae bacterium]|nr:ABC transporter substrate-binding protein [Oscillospiraceae bacterium]